MKITLYLRYVAIPITGIMYSGASGHGFGIFGWTLLESQSYPLNPEAVIPYNESLALFAEAAHEFVGYTLVVASLLHFIGAIKHHVIDKDFTLLRMLGK